MTHEDILRLLDDYLEGALNPEEARRFDEHLSGCPGCRKELARTGSLLDTAAALRDRLVPPSRDLWPSIRSRIDRPSGWNPELWWGAVRRRLFTPAFWTLAGGVAVLVASVALYQHGVFTPGTPERISDTSGALSAVTDMRDLSHQARIDLETGLKSRGGQLPGNAGEDFERNLTLLDQAIQESRSALDKDPENPGLQRSLLSVYQKQLNLLRWATRLMQQT